MPQGGEKQSFPAMPRDVMGGATTAAGGDWHRVIDCPASVR